MNYKIILLLVIALVSVSASFATIESDVDDLQDDVMAIDEMEVTSSSNDVGKNYSDKEISDIQKQQLIWYSRTYHTNDDLDFLIDYFKTHEVLDGADMDSPENPFPYKDTDFRIIGYYYLDKLTTGQYMKYISLSKYLTDGPYKPSESNELGEIALIFLYGKNTSNISDSSNENSGDVLVDNNTIDENSDDILVENTSSSHKDTPTVKAGMESTGLPVVALILAILVSIVCYRRRE